MVSASDKGKTPLDPPLSGGNGERGDEVSSPPLTRGGREGFAFVAYNKKLVELARANRKQPTAAESKFWYQLLRMSNLNGYKFTRQKPLENFIVDFYCAQLKLAIEIDGDSHAEAVDYDLFRTQALNGLGVTVVRYTNDDVMQNLQGIYIDLLQRIAELKGRD